MANGNVEQLANFLNQLPQLMQRRRSLDLEERRLDLFAQQQANTIANQEKIRRESQERQSFNEFNQIFDALKGSPETQRLLLDQHPVFKNNPALKAKYKEEMENRDSLNDRINSIYAMRPTQSILEARTILNDKYVDPVQRTELAKFISDQEDKLTVTMKELMDDPEFINVRQIDADIKALQQGTRDFELRKKAEEAGIPFDQFKYNLLSDSYDTLETELNRLQGKALKPIGAFPGEKIEQEGGSGEGGSGEGGSGEGGSGKDKPFQGKLIDLGAGMMDSVLSDDKLVDSILKDMSDDTLQDTTIPSQEFQFPASTTGIDSQSLLESSPRADAMMTSMAIQNVLNPQAEKSRQDFLQRNK